MLNLNNLRTFYMVAKNKSVLLASEELFISQPAVSNALKKIQQELKTPLFVKNGRNLELTEKGKKLYIKAEKLFEIEKDIERFISQNDEETKLITVGVVTLYERFAMLNIMACFEGSDKDITVSVQSGNSKRLIQLLEEKKVDMAITGDLIDKDKSNMLFTPYAKHQNYLVIPKGHKLFGKESFLPSDIASERMVFKESGSSVRKSVENYFLKHYIQTKTVAELSNLDSILDVALHEKCLAFIPDMALDGMIKNNDNFSFALPENDEIAFYIYLVTRQKGNYPENIWNKIQAFADKSHKKSPTLL